MRILGWLLFAATCVMFVLQGVFVAASNFSMTSYEVLVTQVFPLLGIGAIVGAGVGALIVSRYPRNLIGWLLLVGQLGSVIGLAAEAFRILAVQGVVTSPIGRPDCGLPARHVRSDIHCHRHGGDLHDRAGRAAAVPAVAARRRRPDRGAQSLRCAAIAHDTQPMSICPVQVGTVGTFADAGCCSRASP